MKTVFADTFYFIALLHVDDARHAAAAAYAAAAGQLVVTTVWVLTEVADGLAPYDARTQFEVLLQSLNSDSQTEVVPADQALWNRGVKLYNDRPDKEWSLTDCISFIVMQDRNLTDALTGDHHFEQAGFHALLK